MTVVFVPSAPTRVIGSAAADHVDIAAVTPTCAEAVAPTVNVSDPALAFVSVTAVTPDDELVAVNRSSEVAFAASFAFVARACTNPLIVCSDEMNELVLVSLFLSRVCGTPSTLINELMRSVVLSPLTSPSIARLVLEDTDDDIVDTPWRRGDGQEGDAASREA